MPRKRRAKTGGMVFHVLNRGNAGAEVFHDADDYAGFVELFGLAQRRVSVRVLGWCLMPNHFHLVVRPWADGDLGRWMQSLATAHAGRHHRRYGTSGHIWQGRYRSFPVQRREPSGVDRPGVLETVSPLWTVLRYVERNPVRARRVRRAHRWQWSSLRWCLGHEDLPDWVHPSWLSRPEGWQEWVNQPEAAEELAALRRSVQRGRPFGTDRWVQRTARLLGLESTLRPRGRPPKTQKK